MQNQNQSQGRQQGDNDDTKGLQQEGEAPGGADEGRSHNERVRKRQEEEQRRQQREPGSSV